MIEQLNIKVNMHICLYGVGGELKDERMIHNAVTTAGKDGIADQLLAAPSLTKLGWMAIGTGTPSGSALGTETSRVAFTSKLRSGAVVTMVGNWAAGTGTGAITEAGTFDQGTIGGNMWMSASFATINKLAADTLQITWTLTVG